MKLMIEISEELFKAIQDNALFGDKKEDVIWELNGAIVHGTLVEEGREAV